jgi:hypothetical protein
MGKRKDLTKSKFLAETATYAIVIERVNSALALSGKDNCYSILNKETGVVEGRFGTLPEAMNYMSNVQEAYNAMASKAESAK